MALSNLPTEPRYWRAMWSVVQPSLRLPVKSFVREIMQGVNSKDHDNVAKDGDRQTKHHWFVEYCQKNPILLATSLITGFGLFLIFSYHYHIGYTPVFNIQSLASLVIASAYAGFVLLIIFSIGLFFPCIFAVAFSFDRKDGLTDREKVKMIIQCFFWTFLIFLVTCIAIYTTEFTVVWMWAYIISLPVCCATYVSWHVLRGGNVSGLFNEHWRLSQRDGSQPIAGETKWKFASYCKNYFSAVRATGCALAEQHRRTVKVATTVGTVGLFQIFPIFIVAQLLAEMTKADQKNLDLPHLIMLLLSVDIFLQLASGYIVWAWISGSDRNKHRLISVIGAICFPLVIGMLTQVGSVFFTIPAFITKIGNFRASEVTLTDQGCRIIRNKYGTLCQHLADGTNKLCGVHVLSRLGSEHYLLASYPPSLTTKVQAASRTTATNYQPVHVQDIFVPSKEIIGIKADSGLRLTSRQKAVEYLEKNFSVCAEDNAQENKPRVSFAEKELFEYDRFELTPHGRELIDKFASSLLERSATKLIISVVGHADQIGSAYHNLSLSQLRAVSVVSHLEAKLKGKVQNLDIHWTGVGSANSVIESSKCPETMLRTERIECLSENRRVEVSVEAF